MREYFNVSFSAMIRDVARTRLVNQDFNFKGFLGRTAGQIVRNDPCELERCQTFARMRQL